MVIPIGIIIMVIPIAISLASPYEGPITVGIDQLPGLIITPGTVDASARVKS